MWIGMKYLQNAASTADYVIKWNSEHVGLKWTLLIDYSLLINLFVRNLVFEKTS